MIYAERVNEAREILEKGVFLSLAELAEFDAKARQNGEHWTGASKTNIALNRYRHNLCPNCGVSAGASHRDGCQPGIVMEAENV